MRRSEQERAEKTQNKKLPKSKKVRQNIIIIIMIFAVISASIYYFVFCGQSTKEKEYDQNKFTQVNGQNFVTATGTTSVGVVAEEFVIDFLEDTDLYVEDIYLDSGDEVEKGSKYLKFTDTSIQDARKELEDAALEASILYRNSVISTQESKIKAQYDYQVSVLTGEQAQAVYDETLQELTQAENEAFEDLQDAQDALTELQDNLTTGFAEKYQVAEKKKAYEETHQLYKDICEKWGMSDEDATSSTTGTDSSVQMGGPQTNTDIVWRKKALTLLKNEDEECEEEYEKAVSDYEDAMDHYEYQLKEALNQVEAAQETYDEAKLNNQKESLSAKTTLETAKVKAKTAQDELNTQISSLDEELSKLQDDCEDAKDNLALFEETVGDGYLYTAGAGTILKVMAQVDNVLSGGNVTIAYKDSSKMTVNVSVSQDYISQLSIGEQTYIRIDELGDYDGSISKISPVSESSSRTSVTYSVEISLSGDISGLSENLTANVIFGMTKEAMNSKSMNNQTLEKESGAKIKQDSMSNQKPESEVGGVPNDKKHE